MSDASLPELSFTSVKFRRSYEMDPVDALLERIAYALKHNAGIELQAPRHYPISRWQTSSLDTTRTKPSTSFLPRGLVIPAQAKL